MWSQSDGCSFHSSFVRLGCPRAAMPADGRPWSGRNSHLKSSLLLFFMPGLPVLSFSSLSRGRFRCTSIISCASYHSEAVRAMRWTSILVELFEKVIKKFPENLA
jgi:hypothetical protein